MKEQKLEYDLVKLSDIELVQTKYNLDAYEVKILKTKNKIKLMKLQLDHEIPLKGLKMQIDDLKKAIKDTQDKIKELEKKEDIISISSKEKYEYKLEDLKCNLSERQLELKLNLPMRDINEALRFAENELKRDEMQMKMYKDRFRNKVKKVPRQQIQLEEEDQD